MLIVDIVFLLILVGFAGAGIKDGLVHTLGRLVGSIIGFAVARAGSLWLGGILALFMPAGIARLVAFLLIFILIIELLGFVFKLIDGVFKILSYIPFLKSINSLLGAIGGFVEGVILTGGAIYLIKAYVLEPHLVSWVTSSVIAQYIEKVFKVLLAVFL